MSSVFLYYLYNVINLSIVVSVSVSIFSSLIPIISISYFQLYIVQESFLIHLSRLIYLIIEQISFLINIYELISFFILTFNSISLLFLLYYQQFFEAYHFISSIMIASKKMLEIFYLIVNMQLIFIYLH
jgi:hypothetical protein